jgi:hypothetical protein
MMRKNPKISLNDQVSFFAFKWQGINITGIIFNMTFLKLFDLFTLRVVTGCAAGKTTTKDEYLDFQMTGLFI